MKKISLILCIMLILTIFCACEIEKIDLKETFGEHINSSSKSETQTSSEENTVVSQEEANISGGNVSNNNSLVVSSSQSSSSESTSSETGWPKREEKTILAPWSPPTAYFNVQGENLWERFVEYLKNPIEYKQPHPEYFQKSKPLEKWAKTQEEILVANFDDNFYTWYLAGGRSGDVEYCIMEGEYKDKYVFDMQIYPIKKADRNKDLLKLVKKKANDQNKFKRSVKKTKYGYYYYVCNLTEDSRHDASIYFRYDDYLIQVGIICVYPDKFDLDDKPFDDEFFKHLKLEYMSLKDTDNSSSPTVSSSDSVSSESLSENTSSQNTTSSEETSTQ